MAGFRIERLLGEGEMGPVYEATQLSLGRAVALRLLGGSRRFGASIDHPNAVPVYEAGVWEGGRFVAGRLVRGRTLSELLDAGSLSPGRFDELMEAITSALTAAHRAGIVHGRVAAHNVIVDRAGTPYLADFGLGRPGTETADLAALATLSSRRPSRARRRWVYRAAPLVAGLGVVAGVAFAGGDEPDDDVAPAPPVASGAVPLGSDLAPGPRRSTGCASDPGPNTPPCTIGQSAIGGRPAEVRESGVVRRWAVRGAEGELTLQVLRARGNRLVRVGFSQPERAGGSGPQAFPVELSVRRGDRIAVLLAPGARIGLRPRASAASRWEGRRTPLPMVPQKLDGELLLRADIEAGVHAASPHQISGTRAARAKPGRVVAETRVEMDGGHTVALRLVRDGRRIALDSFRGARRLGRIAVPDLEVGGRAVELTGACEYPRSVCLTWQNDGDAGPVIHAYSLVRGGRAFRVIG